MTHLYGSTASDDTPIPGEDDTRTGIRTLRAMMSEVKSMHLTATVAREQDAEARRKLAWKVGGAAVPLVLTALAFSARMLFAGLHCRCNGWRT